MAAVLALLVAALVVARAEEPSASLELELKPPATAARILPLPATEAVRADTAQAISEIEAQERLDALVRETIRSPRRRPDLDYDVFSGIQSRGISNALRQR
ncbi:MAG: hypothetical protein HY726_17885 [Candidatus Rokubacteria bacterium]|nr:hypothetical protein [Candidatus Rokubacteria bacterium]